MSAKDRKPKSSRLNSQTGSKPQTTLAPIDYTMPDRLNVPKWNELTLQERKVCEMLIERFSEQEIADALGVARSTAKFHSQNVYNKVGVHDRFAFRTRFGQPHVPL